jgi:hypothetical protein
MEFTNDTKWMLTSALLSCLASKSLISYIIVKTPIHFNTLIEFLIKKFTKK